MNDWSIGEWIFSVFILLFFALAVLEAIIGEWHDNNKSGLPSSKDSEAPVIDANDATDGGNE